MRFWLVGVLLLVPAAAMAQFGKPEALPPALLSPSTPEPGGKPPPLAPEGGEGHGAAPAVPAPPAGAGQAAPAPPAGAGQAAPRCAQPLASGCLSQQSSCQIACPPQWSMNPGAPAFTPTDRAGCMGQCQQRYFACMRLYGCM